MSRAIDQYWRILNAAGPSMTAREWFQQCCLALDKAERLNALTYEDPVYIYVFGNAAKYYFPREFDRDDSDAGDDVKPNLLALTDRFLDLLNP